MTTLGIKTTGRGWRTAALAASLLFMHPVLAQDAAVHEAETAAGSMAELIEQGGGLYNTHCGACHQPDGSGVPGLLYPRCMHRGTDLIYGKVEQCGIPIAPVVAQGVGL